MSRPRKIQTPICEICGKSTAHLQYSGRYAFPRTCSTNCRGKLISKSKTSLVNGVNPAKIAAQKTAKTRRNKNDYSSASKKANETKSRTGIMLEAAQKRLVNQKFDEEFSKKIRAGMNKVGDDGLTAAQRAAYNATQTKIAKGLCVHPSQRSDFENYKKKVWKITRQQNLYALPNFEKRGHISKNGWQLDHKISISKGFQLRLSEEEIGSIHNLQMLPGKDNIRKGTK